MKITTLIFIIIASSPLVFVFALSVTRLNAVNSYALLGMIAMALSFGLKKNSRAALITLFAPLIPTLCMVAFNSDPKLLLSLGSGYLLMFPLMFLSCFSESPRGILTSYLFSYSVAIVILNIVLTAAATIDSLLLQFGVFLVGAFLQRMFPLYPLGGLVAFGELLAGLTALSAIGLAFLIAPPCKTPSIELDNHSRMAKTILLSIISSSLIALLSFVNSSIASLSIAVSALVLVTVIFQLSRRD